MSAQYSSKHGLVKCPSEMLYMNFTDLRNFKNMIPQNVEDISVEAEFDQIKFSAKGMSFGLRVEERCPYSKIALVSYDSPFNFAIQFHFDKKDSLFTEFYIEVQAELNGIMKMMLGGKITEALNKVVDELVEHSR